MHSSTSNISSDAWAATSYYCSKAHINDYKKYLAPSSVSTAMSSRSWSHPTWDWFMPRREIFNKRIHFWQTWHRCWSDRESATQRCHLAPLCAHLPLSIGALHQRHYQTILHQTSPKYLPSTHCQLSPAVTLGSLPLPPNLCLNHHSSPLTNHCLSLRIKH